MTTERIEIEIASSVSGEEQVKKIASSLTSIEASGASASKGLTDAGKAADNASIGFDKASKGLTDAGKAADSSSSGFDKMGISALKINNITQLVGDMVSVLGTGRGACQCSQYRRCLQQPGSPRQTRHR